MAKEPKNANVTYFKVDRDGYIYLTSKTPKDGYKEYYNDKSVLLGYKKIFSATDDGVISFLGIHTAEFDDGKVEYVSISIQNDGEIENIQFPLMTQKRTLSNYAKAIAQVLPNVDFSKRYSLSFDKRKDDGGYTIKNIYFNQSDIDNTPAVPIFHRYKNKAGDNGGDIPNMEQVTGLGGRAEWDTSKQDNFLYDSLMAQIDRFKTYLKMPTRAEESINVNTVETVKEMAKENVKTISPNELLSEDEDDDIPF